MSSIDGYEVNILNKKETYIRLIEMSVSKQFSVQLKGLYFNRLRRLVDFSTSYEFYRGNSFEKEKYIKSCDKILKICRMLKNEAGGR